MSTALRCHKCGYDFSGSGDSAHVCLQQPRAQPKQEQEPTSGFFSREAMKEHSDFHPQPKAGQDEPVFHLKQYGDVTKEQLDCYIATGRIDTCPQHRKPLTDEQIDDLARTMVKGNKSVNWLARAIEAAHGINYQERKAD